jgi:Spy/CpxP family protein refolding chaperone
MRTKLLIVVVAMFLPLWMQAQNVTAGTPGPGPKKDVIFYRQVMGRWWEESDVAQKLQLTDNQIAQLNQIFTQHRLNLHGDLQEEQKANQTLESLLATEQPDEDQVNAQVDQVLSARNKLQREFTTMNVDFRKVLNLDQWKQLKAISQQHVKTFKNFPGPGSGAGPKTLIIQPGGPDTTPGPMLLPPPPDGEF